MGLWEALGLGVLQGVTEFLPISSSAHLSLLQYFLGLEDTPKFFDVMLHVGTLAAVVLYYRRQLFRADGDSQVGGESKQIPLVKLGAYLILATLPAVASAVVFRPSKPDSAKPPTWRNQVGDLREYSAQRPGVVISFLGCTGAVLLAGSRAKGGRVDSSTMRWTHVLGMGIAQAFSATFPGLSRSGMTVSTGMLLGLRGEWAVHFSLLMSIPAVLGAVVLKGRDVDPAWVQQHWLPTLAGTIVSAVVGWFCIRLLVGSVRRGRWWWFTIYVWSLACLVGVLLEMR